MCGIFAFLQKENSLNGYIDKIIHLLNRRGPDFKSGLLQYEICSEQTLNISASILHLRGEEIQRQPLIDSRGNVLLFNGQIYKFSSQTLPESQSDTQFLAQKLKSCKTKSQIIDQLKLIDGPFAIIYLSKRLKTLFYGRDIFGRKSLCLLSGSEKQPICLSSIAIQGIKFGNQLQWSELDCDGFHAFDFNTGLIMKFAWNISNIYHVTDKCNITLEEKPHIVTSTITCDNLVPLNANSQSADTFTSDQKTTALDKLESLLLNAIESRLIYNNPKCLICRKNNAKCISDNCNHSKVAVAFSGGIDSTILALGLHKILPKDETIDLLTIAFKDHSPDRESVGQAFRELRQLEPTRKWRLVVSDVEPSELVHERVRVIRHLIWPCNTVIDDSLGCASWFIGRGSGRSLDSLVSDKTIDFNKELADFLKWDPSNKQTQNREFSKSNYETPATMLYCGSSIDEQLGGYSSHRAAWFKSSSKGIIDEISFQMRRLPTRNLGRDDRVYSDHGRDLKLPYLDFQFVSFLNGLPIGLKMDFSLPLDLGPKMILRLLAIRWGLKETGRRVKRAMQFGTRIANLESTTKEKGDQPCKRLISLNNHEADFSIEG